MRHTPGPWTLCAHLKDQDKCSCSYRGVIWGSDDKAVCQPGHEPAPEGQEGTEPQRYSREVEFANSRLISAAPDLLEACKGLLNCFGLVMTDGERNAVWAARDAVAKAEGRK